MTGWIDRTIGTLQAVAPKFAERLRLLSPGSRRRRKRLQGRSRAEIFSEIHDLNDWEDDESVSGSGSTLASTDPLRNRLSDILSDHQVRSLVDVPCGDFNWMSQLDLDGIDYTGIDIVPALIEGLNESHGGRNRRFITADIVTDDPPPADAVLCRDLLIHLPIADARSVVRKLNTRYDLCMISTNPDVRRNTDIVTGETRHLNLELPPFNLGPPVLTIADPTPRFPNRIVGVWRR